MRRLLHIGEIAQLLGVTTKTIRHYQKIGLLADSDRTEAGYRLFTAQDLLRLQQIRRLQALGLSLKKIKIILGKAAHEHSLHDVLQALDKELATEIQTLQERRIHIQSLLAEIPITTVEELPVEAPSMVAVQQLLSAYLPRLSPEILETEKKLWSLFDTFHWPAEYQTSINEVLYYYASKPGLLEQLVYMGEQVVTLAGLPEDASEVEQLLEHFLANEEIVTMLRVINELSQQFPQMEKPFTSIFGELVAEVLSPAQLRFYKELQRRVAALPER